MGFFSSQANSFITLILSRVIEGTGYVLIAVSAPALISQVSQPKNRAVAMAIWSTWIPISVSIMLVLSPIILKHNEWRSVWLFTSLFTLGWLAITASSFFRHHQQHHANKAKPGINLTGVFTKPPLMLAAGFACYSAVFTITISMMPSVWLATKEISSWWLSIIVASCVIGNLAGGWLVSKGIPTSLILVSSFVIPTCFLGGGSIFRCAAILATTALCRLLHFDWRYSSWSYICCHSFLC